MKQMSLSITEEQKQLIRDGATHCIVSYYESEQGANGWIEQVGSEADLQITTKLVVVPTGVTAHSEIWETADIRALL